MWIYKLLSNTTASRQAMSSIAVQYHSKPSNEVYTETEKILPTVILNVFCAF
jgi:hypothetical protein